MNENRISKDPITIEKVKEGEKLSDCPICFEKCNDSSEILSCNHKFHISCIENWLLKKTTCPCCRKVILECKEDSNDDEDSDSDDAAIVRNYDMIRRLHRREYLNSIYDEIQIQEIAQKFSEIYYQYNCAEFLQDTQKCNELYDRMLQFDSFHT
jgi:hypothetical protein